MLPLALDLSLLPSALAGAGAPLLRRLTLLDSEHVGGLTIFCAEPDSELTKAAGGRLEFRLPDEADIAALRVLFIAGLPDIESARLVTIARNHNVLVNVEDTPPLCDFHVPAILRRGDLAISISTGGRSPSLARRVQRYLADLFPERWADRTQHLADLRDSLYANGASPAEVAGASDALIDKEGWLPRRS